MYETYLTPHSLLIEQAHAEQHKLRSRAECVALALIALYYLDRLDALLSEALQRAETASVK